MPAVVQAVPRRPDAHTMQAGSGPASTGCRSGARTQSVRQAGSTHQRTVACAGSTPPCPVCGSCTSSSMICVPRPQLKSSRPDVQGTCVLTAEGSISAVISPDLSILSQAGSLALTSRGSVSPHVGVCLAPPTLLSQAVATPERHMPTSNLRASTLQGQYHSYKCCSCSSSAGAVVCIS